MATENDGDTTTSTFHWKIENVSHCWWLEDREKIVSPKFDGLEGTKWSLWLYLKGCKEDVIVVDEICVKLYRETDCSGPELVEVEYHLSFLGEASPILKEYTDKGSFKTGQTSLFLILETQEKVFVNKRKKFLPEDTLTVQCTLRKAEKERGREGLVKPKDAFARTVLKVVRESFDWRIDKFSTLQPGVRKKLKNDSIEFDLVLNGDLDKKLDIDVISVHDCIKYISFNTSIVDSEGEKKSCGIKRYSVCDDLEKGVLSNMLTFPAQLLENKNRYFPNDVLPLDFEAVLSSVEHSYCIKYSAKVVEQEKNENIAVLIENFKAMYNDRIFSDTELRTSTKTFPAHKNILSARSPVFRRMFSPDKKEKSSGHVDIEDLEDDTVRRMLLFMYTGFIEDLWFESASKLYTAADKYEIFSLKTKCSSFLKENLSRANSCSVLCLADQHQDVDLKNAVMVYIVKNEGLFSSLEWEPFMNLNPELAEEVMFKRLLF